MLLENIEKARVSLDKAPEPGPLDAEFEKEPDFEPDEGTLLAPVEAVGAASSLLDKHTPGTNAGGTFGGRRSHSLPRQSSRPGLPIRAQTAYRCNPSV